MAQFRGFIAVDIETSQHMKAFSQEIKQSGANVKVVDPEKIHITLKFLGDTDESKIDEITTVIQETVKQNHPFEIQYKGTGVFPNQNYIKVIWIGIEKGGEQLKDIATRLDENLAEQGFKKEKREFSPHLTVARMRSARNKEMILKILDSYASTVFGEQQVQSIKLMKSDLTREGPIYTTLKEIKL